MGPGLNSPHNHFFCHQQRCLHILCGLHNKSQINHLVSHVNCSSIGLWSLTVIYVKNVKCRLITVGITHWYTPHDLRTAMFHRIQTTERIVSPACPDCQSIMTKICAIFLQFDSTCNTINIEHNNLSSCDTCVRDKFADDVMMT